MKLTSASAATLSAPAQGALWMAGAAVCFSGMIVLIRMGVEVLHPFQVAFFRNLFALAFILPWVLRSGFGALKTRRLGAYTWRAVTGLSAMLLWFLALSMMPMAEAVSLSFTAPLFATIGAALFLGEIVRARRWSATALGFIGVLVIVRPGLEALSLPALLVLASALGAAVSMLIVKSLARTEPSAAMVAYMGIFLTPMSLVPALFVWQTPDLPTLGIMVGIAALATVAHLCFTHSMHLADASAVIPLDYLRLPLVALLGWALFGEIMDVWSWLGAAIIIGATLYIARREAVVARERRPHDPAPVATGAAREKL